MGNWADWFLSFKHKPFLLKNFFLIVHGLNAFADSTQ